MPHSFSIQDYIGNRYLASHSKSATVHNQYRPYVVHDATKLNSWAYTIPASLCQQTASGYYESASEHLTAAAGCDVGGDYKYGYASPTAAYDYSSGQYVQAVTEQSYHKYASVANADVYYNSFAWLQLHRFSCGSLLYLFLFVCYVLVFDYLISDLSN